MSNKKKEGEKGERRRCYYQWKPVSVVMEEEGVYERVFARYYFLLVKTETERG